MKLPPLPFLKTLRPGRLIPFPLQKVVLERALDMVFREQLDSGALDFLKQRWIAVVIEDAGLHWTITLGPRGLQLINGGVEPEVTFRGELREFVLLASRRRDPDTLFFQRRLSVTGDTELGLSCKNLMDSVEWERWPPVARQLLQTAGELFDS